MAKWRRIRLIGGGGFAEVHLCIRNGDTANRYAMKCLSPGKPPEARERFLREIEIHRQIDHRHVVPIIDADESADFPWYVMPLALTSLAESAVDSATGLPAARPDQAWIIRDACLGLAEAHRLGIIHRDIKPHNILIFEDGDGSYAAVSDFGLGALSAADSDRLTRLGQVMGTYAYMAPEQQVGALNCTPATDVFSLGLVLYDVLAGGRTHPLDLQSVPVSFRPVIARACDTNPSARYPDGETMLADLDRAMAAHVLPAAPAQEAAREAAAQLVDRGSWATVDVDVTARLLLEAAQDRDFLLRFVPQLVPELVRALFKSSPDEAGQLFEAYDAALTADMSFGYYDVMADFYRNVFRSTKRLDLRQRIVARLSGIGSSVNRYYVGRVFAAVVCTTDDQEAQEYAARHLASHPDELAFCREYFEGREDVPPAIRRLLDA